MSKRRRPTTFEPLPMYLELDIPRISPEMAEKLKKPAKQEDMWGSIVIDLDEGTETKISYSF